jgi:hypothetical protein
LRLWGATLPSYSLALKPWVSVVSQERFPLAEPLPLAVMWRPLIGCFLRVGQAHALPALVDWDSCHLDEKNQNAE